MPPSLTRPAWKKQFLSRRFCRELLVKREAYVSSTEAGDAPLRRQIAICLFEGDEIDRVYTIRDNDKATPTVVKYRAHRRFATFYS